MEQEPSNLEERLIVVSSKVNLAFKNLVESDPKLEREDTLKGILNLISEYKQLLEDASKLSAQERAKNYHVAYNCITYISEITSYIQKSSFSFETVKPIVECILAMENNLILSDVKYMNKHTQLYVNLCKIYEESEYYQPAIVLLDMAVKKYEELKGIYQMDQPVPHYVTEILEANLLTLKVLSLKFGIHSGVVPHADWKKKVDEEFKDNVGHKLLALVECLQTETKRNSNVFTKSGKAFKESLVQQGYEMVKPYLEVLSRGLKEMKEKIEFEVTFEEKKMTQTLKQEEVNQEIKKKRELIGKHIKESELRRASKAFPIEYHSELIKHAFQVRNHKILEELLHCAMIRVECRRIEVPYVTNIKFEASNTPENKPKVGYDKIGFDLNDANLKEQLKRLRKSGKTDPNALAEVEATESVPAAKDAKKGAKEPPPAAQKPKKSPEEPTDWELQQLNHTYVYMHIKRSVNPEKAIYDMKVVMGHEEKGPVGYEDTRRIIVPYIQKNQKVSQPPLEQYKGVRQSTQLVPYLILSHSQNGLENEEERRTSIIDVQPIVGKNPMVPAPAGYTKLETDLRQVPEQFVKMPDQTYIYLAYKTDEEFHISSRMIEIINAFFDVENTYNRKTDKPLEEIEKYTQISINFDLQKLEEFFITLQDCLKGVLGQDFYLEKNDFLTHLVLEVWSRYLKEPLRQIEYLMEQRLNKEIIDHDYEVFKSIIEKSKPIFQRGLKVLNLIMVNNKKCDVLLLSKINLELIKLLEENKEYYLASENAKLALDRVRVARDEYLSKSVESMADRLLPFSITCSNSTLSETLDRMKAKYRSQKLLIEKTINIRKRASEGKQPLSEQQLKHAELQWDLNRKPDAFDGIVADLKAQHSEIFSLLSAIDVDLNNIYFRVTLKHGDELKKRGVSHSGGLNTELQGMSSTLAQKLGFLETKGNQKEQKNLKELQTTLIKAQKLPPPKPENSRPEKKLLEENLKNPYTLCLLMSNLGALNSGNEDKKFYLKESLRAIYQCQKLEQSLLENCVDNSIFIFSSMFDSEINPEAKSSFKADPFVNLYNGVWPCQGQKAASPILLGKNSSTIYMKLPPFIFKDKKKKKAIANMKLFGKISANGVDVSANCDQLSGTGIKHPLGKVIKVSYLKPNNKYCFAVGPLNEHEEMLQIGTTSPDVPTFNSLPLSSLAANLAKVAYQIGEYDIAEEAARIVAKQYTRQSNIINPKTDAPNKLYKLSLDQKKLSKASLLEFRLISQSLYILALCERKKLQALKQTGSLVQSQLKQREIANLISLTTSLQPALAVPMTSMVALLQETSDNSFPLIEGFMLSMFQQQYFSPKIRKSGIRILRNLMKWGLEHNEPEIARRFMYKWTERKWFVLGKMIQVEEKKQAKKGGKDPKEPQEQKMIDKFCHYMVEKSPQILQQFEDSLCTISDEYSDMITLYAESVKQRVQQLADSVDNGSEKAEEIVNRLNAKLELAEFLKDPINSLGKISNTSKTYLEFNCRLIRRALELSSQSEIKSINQKVEEMQISIQTDQTKLSQQILALMEKAFESDIQFSPESKNWISFMIEKTGKDLSSTLEIYTNYENKQTELSKSLRTKSLFLNPKHEDYDYLHLWMSEFYHLKAVSLISTISDNEYFKTEYRIKPIFTNRQFLKLQTLRKIQKEVEIMGKQKCEYPQQQSQVLQAVTKNIMHGVYSAFCCENWVKMLNLITILENFLNFYSINPFSHSSNKLWLHMSIISLMINKMLCKIREEGIHTFKSRFNKKLENTELQSIMEVMSPETTEYSHIFEPLYNDYSPSYFIPELSSNTSKQPWFLAHPSIKINSLSSILTYTVQGLYIKGQKNNVIINLLREFCNVTDHWFSLDLLPLMIDAQKKIAEVVRGNISNEEGQLRSVEETFKSKKEKDKKKRQAQITGEKASYEIEYEDKKTQLIQSLQLLNEENNFVSAQIRASNTVIAEIERDYNKASLSQKEHKKYITEFGEDEQNVYNTYRSQSSALEKESEAKKGLNKLNILSKNRKNLLKDLISKYDEIYLKLKNNKTSKDALSEIVNRNEVGNLYYALGDSTDSASESESVHKAFEFWNDSLATIFRKVNPIDNYAQMIEQHGVGLAHNIGFKELLMSLGLIYKISQFTSHKNLHLQQQCVVFASEIGLKLFQTDMCHPQCLHGFVNYRLDSFNQYQKHLYEDEVNIQQISNALEHFILKGLDIFDDFLLIKTLPLCCLLEYISIDILKAPELSIKVKLLKSMVLSKSGFVKESSISLFYVSQKKDLPIMWLENSDNLKRQKGRNWVPESVLLKNHKPFFDSDNKEAISKIKQLNFPENLLKQTAFEISVMFNLAKWALLAKVYENEICQNFEINEERLHNLTEIQLNLRECLKKFASIEEFERQKEQLQQMHLRLTKGGVDEELQKQKEKKESEIKQYMKQSGFTEAHVQNCLSASFNALKRIDIIEFMSRIRFYIHKIQHSKNMSVNSFYILKNGINNFNRYCYLARKVETGQDPELGVLEAPAAQQTGKKEDKKGGKKDLEVSKPTTSQEIDPQEQHRLIKQSQQKSKRLSPNSFWNLKLTFELGNLLYRQNNFLVALKIFQSLLNNCQQYKETYFASYGQVGIERCKIRLGSLSKQRFIELISRLSKNSYKDSNFINLLMDFGEIVQNPLKKELFAKGLQEVSKIWQMHGMKKYLAGISQAPIRRMYGISDELTAEEEDLIRKKQKQQEKKGGKDDKKPPKKDDGKKKKEYIKSQYKVHPLYQHKEINLFEEDSIELSNHFREYVFDSHPNYYPSNVFNGLAKIYIKCFCRLYETKVKGEEQLKAEEEEMLSKLIRISEDYPENHLQKLLLLKNQASISSNKFTRSFENYLNSLSKADTKKLKIPFEDWPRNQRLNALPSYFVFLNEQRRHLSESSDTYQKLIETIPKVPLIIENDVQLDDFVYDFSCVLCMQIEYCGTLLPKYQALEDQSRVQEQKLQQRKSLTKRLLQLVRYSINLGTARKTLSEEYYNFSKKELDANTKIEEDLSSDIKNIDKQCKQAYPLFLKEAAKAKQAITSLDILTYLLKLRRESQVMTFSNPLDHSLRKCHRILSSSLSSFKQNCVIKPPNMEEDAEINEADLVMVKSKRSKLQSHGDQPKVEHETYLYLFWAQDEETRIRSGKFNIEMNQLSKMLEKCYKIQSKLKTSTSQSESIRARNYKQLESPFNEVLRELAGRFNPDSAFNQELMNQKAVKLSENSITILIDLLNGECDVKNEEFNLFLGSLHHSKYSLKAESRATSQKQAIEEGKNLESLAQA